MKKWGQIALCLYFLRGMNVRKRGIFLGEGGEKARARREAVPWEGILCCSKIAVFVDG